jgi:hypothetical protein
MSVPASWGGSETAGLRRGAHRLEVTVGGAVAFAKDIVVETPFASLVVRGAGAPLPAAVVGDHCVERTVTESVALQGEVAVRLGESIALRRPLEGHAVGTLRVVRTIAHDPIQKRALHETIDVSLGGADASASTDDAELGGGWVHGDRMGFALCHPDFPDALRRLAGPSKSALAFLTSDARADDLLEGGFIVPFLGVRPLWPYRVLLLSSPTTVPPLPLGQRLALTRRVALATSDRYDVLLAETLSGPTDALKARIGSFRHAGGGAYELSVFVAGGEIATFVLRRIADVASGAVDPIVNVDVHAMWKDGEEPLSRLA